MSGFQKDVQKALSHIHYLSESIGGRGSCTKNEQLAGEYAARQMRALSVKNIRAESFQAIPSTYWGFAMAFGAAITGSLLVVLFGGRGVMALGALLSAAGVWGMLAETDFAASWVRWSLPKKESRNVIGVVPPKGPVNRRVILAAHLDTHRTPVFYSSERWYSMFTLLVSLGVLGMLLAVIVFLLGSLLDWGWVRVAAVPLLGIQLFGIGMCLHADFTPYSPGANDNASGAAAVLAIAARLQRTPLRRTEIHLAFTGCEEVGDWGMADFLKRHSAELGDDAVYIILDEVGLGKIKYLVIDGLILKYRTHPEALELARESRRRLPQIPISEGPGLAYTDALQATKQGRIALTVCTVPEPNSGIVSHWHRLTDRLETLNHQDLENTLEFVWMLLQIIDEGKPVSGE